MDIEVLDITNSPELLIEKAYRLCYGGEVKEDVNRTFISGCIKNGHESPLEHAKATFLIHDVSRALTHQLVRHRLASYTQRSQRYCKENNFEYVIPEKIREDKKALYKYVDTMKMIASSYDELVNLGLKREDARYVLPNACYTTIMVTMNFRELRHFISLRSDSHAQKEIRDLSDMILSEMYQFAPSVFEDLFVKYFPDGLDTVKYIGDKQDGPKTHIGPQKNCTE